MLAAKCCPQGNVEVAGGWSGAVEKLPEFGGGVAGDHMDRGQVVADVVASPNASGRVADMSKLAIITPTSTSRTTRRSGLHNALTGP
jgi:hypothetical protein